MKYQLETITFKQLLNIRKKIFENAEIVYLEEKSAGRSTWNIPTINQNYNSYFNRFYTAGDLNEKTYKTKYGWLTEELVRRWNETVFGFQFGKLRKEHLKRSKDPALFQKLKEVNENMAQYWGWDVKSLKESIKNGKFISFWVWHKLHGDTRSQFRHWWDALSHEKKFKGGEILEFRAVTTHNHVFYMFKEAPTHMPSWKPYLRNVRRAAFRDLSNKTFMVIGYDQQKPYKTFSYKKSAGSHRLVSILPMGSTEIYYVPEQFLKVSRKKAIKDARQQK